jgi:hypothetical protein
MPILEFALDTLQDHTVQVHVGTQQGPVSVMLDHAIIGTLFTLDEQINGKDFRLPDQSVLRISISGGQANAWRNGRPLPLTSAPLDYAQKKKDARGSLQGNVRIVLILNILLLAVLALWNLVLAVQAFPVQNRYLAPLVLGIMPALGLIGLLALSFWKKWGIYLAAITAVGALGATLALGQFDFRPILPILAGLLLIYTLRSSGYWHQMD